ncbi:TPA: hypothetical protein ACKRJN_000885 [Proteus mirabilis]
MRRLLPTGAINLAAYAFFEPQEPLIPFIPSWYNGMGISYVTFSG